MCKRLKIDAPRGPRTLCYGIRYSIFAEIEIKLTEQPTYYRGQMFTSRYLSYECHLRIVPQREKQSRLLGRCFYQCSHSQKYLRREFARILLIRGNGK